MKNNLLVVRLLGALLVCHLASCHQHHQHPSVDHKHGTGSAGAGRAHYASSNSDGNTNGHRRPPYSSNWNLQQHHQGRQNEEPAKDIEGDELILLGDQGSGCWDDDDCTTLTDMGAATDDLITPRILSIPRTTISPRQSITTPRYYVAGRGGQPSNKRQCDDGDDEECVEGSGSDDNDGEPSSTSGHHRGIIYGVPTLSPPWPGGNPIAMPPTTVRYERPPFIYATAPPTPSTPRTEEVDRSILFTSRPIPPVYTGRSYTPQPRPSPPPRPTGKPVIVDVPKPMIPTYVKEKEPIKPKPANTHTTYSKSSADRTALIIGLIAVILVVIVIIAPIIMFVKVRYRSNGACKTVIEDRKNSHYQFATAATPPTTLLTAAAAAAATNGASHHGSVTHLHNGSVEFKHQQQQQQQQQLAAKLPKKNKDLEWYV